MSLFLANKKSFSIQKKNVIYNLILINKNLLPNKNKRINKEIKLQTIVT